MSSQINHILEEAMELSPPERAKLATSILSSLDEPDAGIDKLWQKEADERVDAYKRGELRSKSLQEVLAKYRK